MAALAGPARRPARTPARPRTLASIEPATEPPSKKRKYTPVAPATAPMIVEEGGRDELDSQPVAKNISHTAPRARSRREPSSKLLAEDGEPPSVLRSAMQTRPRRDRPERYIPPPTTPRPRYSSAAAAAAASQASDGYKPREERSWEEFHHELDIEGALPLHTADEVDGRMPKPDLKLQKLGLQGLDGRPLVNGDVEMKDSDNAEVQLQSSSHITPIKRKPGRPPRRAESMLSGLGSPPAPRILPLPTQNPKERLNLPKASFRQFSHFLQYEEDQRENKLNYVDRTMAHIGYQESDQFDLPGKTLIRLSEGQQVEDEAEVSLRLESDGLAEDGQGPAVLGRVEYDMDEQDVAWLEDMNELRRTEGVDAIKPSIFEITMTQIEKEYHALEKRIPKPQPRHAQTQRPRSSSQAAVNGDPNPPGDEPDSKCSICDDGDCENTNAIIFCDGCDLAVHQECYGVPFIPEGQWFCRKCKEIGRGTPTCIFCPNVDGAFKQTNTLRWSHLLCALWIPEVSLANTTFMEPVADVDKVPKGRWKLNCYICQQKMGACIQCGNKNCYQAFHVTCARRAKLFLKMKSPHQAGLDPNTMKAFCDKHVPQDWRHDHDTDNATIEAKQWYRHAMKDRKWADNQNAAVELGAPPQPDGGLPSDGLTADDTIAVTKRRRNQPQKMSWRLPSGAPVVPAVVHNSVDSGLTRFTIRKRREFVEKACRYWTLKREARRGAALLKRLQLQLESFSTMEITRRNFAGMGAAGRPRLIRRIEFAEMLQTDMAHLTALCSAVREREELRLKEIELLRELVDTVYFPIPTLLWPILRRAQKLDEKSALFHSGFEILADRLRARYYTSVSDFSTDLSRVFAQVLASYEHLDNGSDADIEAIYSRLHEVQPGTAEHMALTQEQKEIKRVAKKIVKAVKEPLEEAMTKEAALRGREQEAELRKLDSMGMFSSAASRALDVDGEEEAEPAAKRRQASNASAVSGASPGDAAGGDAEMPDADEQTEVIHVKMARHHDSVPTPTNKRTPASRAASRASSNPAPTAKTASTKPTEPLSPPTSRSCSAPTAAAANGAPADPTDVLANGGVPWYLTEFDPVGTTIYEERYTGRAVLRDMSEELSDMDEDTLTELGASAINSAEATPVGGRKAAVVAAKAVGQAGKKKKKARKSFWSRAR